MKLIEIGAEITADKVHAGMVIDIYGDSQRVMVERVADNGYGAVLIHNGIKWQGLSTNETVTVAGYFNP